MSAGQLLMVIIGITLINKKTNTTIGGCTIYVPVCDLREFINLIFWGQILDEKEITILILRISYT